MAAQMSVRGFGQGNFRLSAQQAQRTEKAVHLRDGPQVMFPGRSSATVVKEPMAGPVERLKFASIAGGLVDFSEPLDG